jgi:hypothetical protein
MILQCTLPYCGQEFVCEPEDAGLYYVESDDGQFGETRCLLHLNIPVNTTIEHSRTWTSLLESEETL